MNFEQLLEIATAHAQDPIAHPSIQIPSDWGQGRTSFGGVSAALMYVAIKQKVASDRQMRSFNCNFVGPLLTDTGFVIEVEVLREGKNATQVVAKAIQDDKVAVLCQVCFGVPRQSKIAVPNQDTHTMPIPKKAKFMPQIPKVTPKFLRHFELAIDDGSLPFTASKKSHIHGWMRFKNRTNPATDAHLICLIDAWPPTVLQMLRWPAPASTMCWNVEFIHPHSDFAVDDWFAYQVNTRQAQDGYGHTEANIWDQAGELVAISRQAVAIFD